MPIAIDSARMAVNNISNQVFASYKALSMHFVVHHHDHLSEAMGLAAQEILWHPAAESALHFLKKDYMEKSKILGIAYAQKNSILTSNTPKRYLCLCHLNLGQYETLEELKRAAWFFAWHAINHIEKFEDHHTTGRSHSQRKNNYVRVTIRDNIERTGYNLCADTFSAIMASYEGDSFAAQKMAVQKAGHVLQDNIGCNPEYYAFPMTVDAAQKAIRLYEERRLSKRRSVREAIKLSLTMRDLFDQEALKHWIAFASHAQNMIWRGIEKDKVIGAAMYMSSHTQTRLIAHQICELLELEPYSINGDTDFHNSFLNAKMAEKRYNSLIDETFEKLLTQALQAKNGHVFEEAADRQNKDLCTGEINGWCALALQYAGKAVDVALKSGNDPAMLAIKEFNACRAKITLDDLRLLNRNIIQEKRSGTTVTMEKIKAICNQHDNLELIRQSINMTLKTSPLSDNRKAVSV